MGTAAIRIALLYDTDCSYVAYQTDVGVITVCILLEHTHSNNMACVFVHLGFLAGDYLSDFIHLVEPDYRFHDTDHRIKDKLCKTTATLVH